LEISTMPFAFRHLMLERPLAVLDLETTGVDVRNDRIVEVAVLKFAPDAEPVRYRRLINPGIPIPAAASAIHGITDEVIAEKRRFEVIAPRLARLLADADLAGFNVRRFDLPLLLAEFRRAGVDLPIAGRAVLDIQQIYHKYEPRDLAAAVAYYCGRAHDGAHAAMADVEATAAVLDAQVGHYDELPETVADLSELLTEVDVAGRFRCDAGVVVFAFGKHLGRPLEEVARDEPGYLRWMLGQDFLDDVKELVEQALATLS
jgi:DNA polymerase-3 subunit epsilon